MGALGNYYFSQYERGNRDVIGALMAEEANLLHARRLARIHGWWDPVTSTMQGLRHLYEHMGRRSEWARLVKEIVPDFVDPATDGPLLGREEDWGLVTNYRVRLAREARQWPEAERLQRVCVDWVRERASTALAAPSGELDPAQRNAIRTLAASLHELAQIQREQEDPDCVAAYEGSLRLSERIGDRAAAATCAFNLGNAYKNIPELRDLEKAEEWYQRNLAMYEANQHHDIAQCLCQLGAVAWERFRASASPDRSKPKSWRFLLPWRWLRRRATLNPIQHLEQAAQRYREALDLLPASAVNDLAVAHNQLGSIYRDGGDVGRALEHYRQAIRLLETAGDVHRAGTARANVALALAGAGRFEDALAFARAALRDFGTFGDRAASDMQDTQQLIAQIEKDLETSDKKANS